MEQRSFRSLCGTACRSRRGRPALGEVAHLTHEDDELAKHQTGNRAPAAALDRRRHRPRVPVLPTREVAVARGKDEAVSEASAIQAGTGSTLSPSSISVVEPFCVVVVWQSTARCVLVVRSSSPSTRRSAPGSPSLRTRPDRFASAFGRVGLAAPHRSISSMTGIGDSTTDRCGSPARAAAVTSRGSRSSSGTDP